MRLFILPVICFLSLALLLMPGCATNKKKGDDISGFRQMYLNTTARYNGYFNAGLILDNTYMQINESFRDNYSQVLPLYPYAAYEDSKPYREQLDEVIKKVSIVISLRRESRWTDECYLMMGEAQFLKQDYEAAEEVFRYLTTEYDPTTVRNRGRYTDEPQPVRRGSQQASRSQRGRNTRSAPPRQQQRQTAAQQNGMPNIKQGIGNTLVYKDGLVWLAKTLAERGFYDRAMIPVNRLKKDEDLPSYLIPELAKVEAHIYLKQRRFDRAIEPLVRAIEHEPDRAMRARMHFILAQIYEMEQSPELAASSYQQVLRLRTNYEMEFSARLNMMRTAYFSGSESAAETERLLARMLRDEKNNEFHDKIHYALAEVYLREGDRNKAMDALQASLRSGGGTSAQNVEAYYLLASMFYDDEDYVSAKDYFDKALEVMPRDDHRFTRVQRMSNNLTDIARNILIIQEQDSLLAMRNMTREERQALARSLRTDRSEETGKDGTAIPGVQVSVQEGAVTGQSAFWAYNPQSVDRGQRDFIRVWGQRPLEDDWRRSQRTSGFAADIEEIALEIVEQDVSDDELASLFSNVPQTDEEAAKAENKIAEAMLELGALYREKIGNNEKSIEVLEELVRRFPNFEKMPDALYYLYIAYMDVDAVKSRYYKDEIIRRYPESSYARFLSDPSAMDAYTRAQRQMEAHYEQTYAFFTSGKFDLALEYAQKADSLFGEGYSLRPRFALLMAMCAGHTGGTEAYREALRSFIANFPRTPEEMRAREILRILGSDGTDDSTPAEATSTFSTSEFSRKPEEAHYLMLHLTATRPNINDVQVKISDYNRKYHGLAGYRVTSLMLDTETSLVVIRSFDSESRAMAYFREVTKDLNEFTGTKAAEPFIIGQENYRKLLRGKNLEGYKAFFRENYK